MGLKLKLRSQERIFLAGALLKNGGTITEFEVLNKVPILREKDILLESDADTPCKRLYVLVQTLYMGASDHMECFRAFSELAKEILAAAPSTAEYFETIHPLVSDRNYYPALREVRKLIEYEAELFEHAKRPE